MECVQNRSSLITKAHQTAENSVKYVNLSRELNMKRINELKPEVDKLAAVAYHFIEYCKELDLIIINLCYPDEREVNKENISIQDIASHLRKIALEIASFQSEKESFVKRASESEYYTKTWSFHKPSAWVVFSVQIFDTLCCDSVKSMQKLLAFLDTNANKTGITREGLLDVFLDDYRCKAEDKIICSFFKLKLHEMYARKCMHHLEETIKIAKVEEEQRGEQGYADMGICIGAYILDFLRIDLKECDHDTSNKVIECTWRLLKALLPTSYLADICDAEVLMEARSIIKAKMIDLTLLLDCDDKRLLRSTSNPDLFDGVTSVRHVQELHSTFDVEKLPRTLSESNLTALVEYKVMHPGYKPLVEGKSNCNKVMHPGYKPLVEGKSNCNDVRLLRSTSNPDLFDGVTLARRIQELSTFDVEKLPRTLSESNLTDLVEYSTNDVILMDIR